MANQEARVSALMSESLIDIRIANSYHKMLNKVPILSRSALPGKTKQQSFIEHLSP